MILNNIKISDGFWIVITIWLTFVEIIANHNLLIFGIGYLLEDQFVRLLSLILNTKILK